MNSIEKSNNIISKIIDDYNSNQMYSKELKKIPKALTDATEKTKNICNELESGRKITNIGDYNKAIISVISAFQNYLLTSIPKDKEQDITEAWRHFKIALDFIGLGKYNLSSNEVESRIEKINSRIEKITKKITREEFKLLIGEPMYKSNEVYTTIKFNDDNFVKSGNDFVKLGGKRYTRARKHHKKYHQKTRKSRKSKKSNNHGVRKTSHRKKK